MVWIFCGVLYSMFTAVYMLYNQHFKINGYILGIWRGFGISLLFAPFLLCFQVPTAWHYWFLLTAQGLCIGIYDSHIFFASAKYGAGPTSRFMAITVLLTTFIWWYLTPDKFWSLMQHGNLFLSISLALSGFTFCYWQMLQNKVSRQAALYTFPAVIALAAMSIITKYIALGSNSLWQALAYYLTIANLVSGLYNLSKYFSDNRTLNIKKKLQNIAAPKIHFSGIFLILFSAALIIAKTIALRLAPNPGYVIALLLLAPFFIAIYNRLHHYPDTLAPKSGWAMLLFLLLLMVLININDAVID